MNESVALTMVAAACGWALFLYATSQAAKAQAKGVLSWLKAAAWGALAVIGVGLGLMPMTARADLIAAEVVAQAKHPDGAVIQLHAVVGPCQSGAMLATYIAPNGMDRVQGCYKVSPNGAGVHVVWFDTDASSLPTRVFKKPEEV